MAAGIDCALVARLRETAALVTHDIGNMVGYAFAAQYRDRVLRFVVIDAPLPGVGRGFARCFALRSPALSSPCLAE